MAKAVTKMLLIDGVGFTYRANVKSRLQEVDLTVKNSQGRVVASANIMRHNHFTYTITKARKVSGSKKLLEVAHSRKPEYYMTQVAMWLAKKC
ncbi:hypothetical protein VH22019_00070 [Vibrio phage VH2_2019]|nr:hypothetical protein VH22019_00070 [Vibrio phage VH2_2019]